MPTLLIRQKVTDFDRWQTAFQQAVQTLRANGAQQERSFRNAHDPDEVLILLEWDDLFRARLFVMSDELVDLLTIAGVTDRPDYWFLEEA